jgi:FdhD protein
MTRHHAMVERDGVIDAVAVEEPLEIRVGGEPVAVTMRTPGHDDELALGFLYGERLIDRAWDVGLSEDLAANTVDVKGRLCRSVERRRFYTTSSCGVCGKGAIEEVTLDLELLPAGPVMAREVLADLPSRLTQPGFDLTGGVHATGLFSEVGELRVVREDVGRHNAMDKVIGHALAAGSLPLHDSALCVSGRLAFELVQKAAVAGAPILVGVGAPTSLAVQLADRVGMTLCGFARRGRLNVYAGADRVA